MKLIATSRPASRPLRAFYEVAEVRSQLLFDTDFLKGRSISRTLTGFVERLVHLSEKLRVAQRVISPHIWIIDPMSVLRECVAVVTGASRGLGKGIAMALGEAGATVYVTGRSDERGTTEGLPGTISETADAVTQRGGKGIAVRCDHTMDAEIAALFAGVRREHGRLDLLVNNVWGGYERQEWSRFNAPFWEQSLSNWSGMFELGVRAHLVAARLAVPIMIPQRRGLIVHTTAWDRDKYLGNLHYDLAKNTVNRMAFGMACELNAHQVAVVALAPGFVGTERVLAAFAGADRVSERLESPEYIGRAVAALAADANVISKSGQVLTVGQLAVEYGFTDIDGRQLPPLMIAT